MTSYSKTIKRPSKGVETRAAILKAAVQHASVEGFDGLTIGSLATKTGMSKSGLFAHFGSKEELQIATLDEAVRRFNEVATMPALLAPRGLKRLISLCNNWLTWTTRCDLAGCPMMTAMNEFDDKPGAVRDALVAHMRRMNEFFIRSIQMTIDTGDFRPETDPEQMAFEFFGIIASCYRSRNLFLDTNANDRARKAFDRLIESALAPQTASATANPSTAILSTASR